MFRKKALLPVCPVQLTNVIKLTTDLSLATEHNLKHQNLTEDNLKK